uniref:Homing endonuclease LAGLIDADG domain-containing protein n=1 Tax=Hypomyces aurantius TaxID=29852 RepID=A0A168RAS9_9HYPO|nr:hypothetical protein [Hypomyces aurantius]ANC62708.1 hypothetical protein [Hypomyces aurantius]
MKTYFNSQSLLNHYSYNALSTMSFLTNCTSVDNRLFYSTPSCPSVSDLGSRDRNKENSNSQFIIIHEGQQIALSYDFIEWLRGFTDAEGCFLIAKTGNTFAFRFLIKLHADDVNALNYIRNSLGGIGDVISVGSVAYYKVTSQKGIKFILEIFTKYPLNSNKHLDFIAFREAYELYVSSVSKTEELAKEIVILKDSMNKKRTNFDSEKPHKINITDNWLLGFVEGDGSFCVAKTGLILTFSLGQKGNLALMEAIQSYLFNLANKNSSTTGRTEVQGESINFIYLTKSSRKSSSEIIYVLIVKNKDYIENILIPYFDSLIFHSKKELDYLDWKSIGKLKNLGLHYLPEGVKLIELILSQMNENRLSSRGIKPVERNFIQSEVIRLLQGPSNYEIREGRIFIKSLNKYHSGRTKTKVELKDQEGLVFKTFDSMNKCAEFLGVSTHTVSKRIKSNSPVIFNNKEFIIHVC